ncbi:MAG: Gfo/Idh/MocA family oxidoreductase [Amaricoccus sp.]
MNVAEADALVALTRARGRKLLVTLNNTGYAMVRQAREMVAAGELGAIRSIQASYIQDWLTKPIDADGQKQAAWRTDPARAGQSAVLADIGVHAYNLACFVSGETAEAVAADLFTAVPGRRLDDNANLLVRWTGGARGTLVASQTSPGHYNDLTVGIYGARAGLVWSSGRPEELRFAPYGEEARALVRGGHGARGEARRPPACPPPTPRATSRPSPTSTATPPPSSAPTAGAKRSTPPAPPSSPTSRTAPAASASSPPPSPRRPPTAPGPGRRDNDARNVSVWDLMAQEGHTAGSFARVEQTSGRGRRARGVIEREDGCVAAAVASSAAPSAASRGLVDSPKRRRKRRCQSALENARSDLTAACTSDARSAHPT